MSNVNPYDEDVETGSDLYIKIPSGSKIKVRLMTPPSKVFKMFDDDKEPGGYRTKPSWVWGVLLYDQSTKTASPRIFESGVSVFSAIKELVNNEDWGDPTKYDIWISKTGSGLETKYSVAPGLRGQVSEEMQTAYDNASIKLPEHGSTQDFRKASKPSEKTTESDPFADN